MIYRVSKRIFDLTCASTGLLLLAPLFVLVSVAIKLDSPGPIFYRGVRTAQYNGRFRIYKFRSMVPDAEVRGGHSTASDDPRVTATGRLMRRFKVDEIPQLVNVIIGDMSLVGPRPQVPYYTDQYQGADLRILDAKPGITDIASLYYIDMDRVLGSGDVDARYAAEVEPVKNRLRRLYVQNRSMTLDLRILVATGLRLLGARRHVAFDLAAE
jgi:lipopolysaccharide/colanic/teichoic acid biosynthesis glycosyltransferase